MAVSLRNTSTSRLYEFRALGTRPDQYVQSPRRHRNFYPSQGRPGDRPVTTLPRMVRYKWAGAGCLGVLVQVNVEVALLHRCPMSLPGTTFPTRLPHSQVSGTAPPVDVVTTVPGHATEALKVQPCDIVRGADSTKIHICGSDDRNTTDRESGHAVSGRVGRIQNTFSFSSVWNFASRIRRS